MKNIDTNSDLRWPAWYWPLFCFLAFYGIAMLQLFLILIGIYNPSEYKVSRIAQIPYYFLKISLVITALYGLAWLFRHGKFTLSKFHFSIFLPLFWSFYTARLIHDTLVGETGLKILQFDIIYYLHPFSTALAIWIPLFVFSTGIPRQSSDRLFRWVLLPAILLGITLAFDLHDHLYRCIVGDGSVWHMTKHLKIAVWRTNEIALCGHVLMVLPLWAYAEKKMPLWLSMPCYFLGSVLMIGTGSRTFFVTTIFVHLFVFVFSTFRSRKDKFATIVVLCIVNALLVCLLKNCIFERNVVDLKSMVAVQEKIQEDTERAILPPENVPNSTEVKIAPSNAISQDAHIAPSNAISQDAHIVSSNTISQDAHKETFKDLRERTPERFKNIYEFDLFYRSIPVGFWKLGTGRFFIWGLAWDDLSKNPFTGSGTTVRGIHPHNEIIEAFISTGVVGGTVFLLILFFGMRDAILLIKKYPTLGWISVVYVTALIKLNLSGMSLRHDWPLWFSLAAMRGTLYFRRNEPGENEASEIVSENQALESNPQPLKESLS